jgi:hypothetical protein
MEWRRLYSELRTLNWFILLVLSLGGYVFLSSSQTIGIILGGLIIMVNFSVLQHTISGAFGLDGSMRKGKAAIITKYYLRLLGLGVILYVLIARGLVDPVGLAIGLSTTVFGIVTIGIQKAIRMNEETI